MATFSTKVEGFPDLEQGVRIGSGRLLMLRFDAQTDGTGGIANGDVIDWIFRVPADRLLFLFMGINYTTPTGVLNTTIALSHQVVDNDIDVFHAYLSGLKTGVPVSTPTIRWRQLSDFVPPPLLQIEGFTISDYVRASANEPNQQFFTAQGANTNWNRLFLYPNETVKMSLVVPATWVASKCASITLPVIQYPASFVDNVVLSLLDRAIYRK